MNSSIEARKKDLYLQIQRGSIAEVEYIIKYIKDVNARSESSGNTLIHFTVIKNSSELNAKTGSSLVIANILLDHGADINIRNYQGISPLHYALLSGHLNIIKLFINRRYDKFKSYPDISSDSESLEDTSNIIKILLNNKSELNITHRDYPILLQFCVRYADEKSLRMILEENMTIDIDVYVPKSTSSILHKAAQTGTPEMIKDLVEYGSAINNCDGEGDTPLICATKWANSENILCLLDYNASVNYRDLQGWTVLHYVAKNGTDTEVVKSILCKVDNINVKGHLDKKTPLHVACGRFLDHGIVQLLLDHGADPNVVDEDGMTPLHAACIIGNVETASYLIKSGANVNSISSQRQNALHFAIRGRRTIYMIELLLRAGCDVNARDIHSKTPLFYIPPRKLIHNSIIIKLLVGFGADINARDSHGDSVLHACCQSFSTTSYNVECFLELNADINLINNDGCTALECALKDYNSIDIRSKYSNTNIVIGLVAYIVKMKSENSYVSEENMKSAKGVKLFKEHELEIERIKRKKIVDSSYVSYYDFLTKDIHKLASFSRNRNIIKVLDCEEYMTDFPLYAELLQKRIDEAKSRLHLLEKAERIFKDCLDNRFSHIILDKIFMYLGDIHLKYFVETFFNVL